jgi:hypothetical protein
VGPFKVAGLTFLNKGYNPFPFLEGVGNPPVEGWLVVNAGSYGMFGGLNRV